MTSRILASLALAVVGFAPLPLSAHEGTIAQALGQSLGSPAGLRRFICQVDCGTVTRTIPVTAGALAYRSASSNFELVNRGLEWGTQNESTTLTVPAPADYAGGPVTFRVFFEFVSDDAGTLQFTVASVGFNSGSSFETFGSVGATPTDSPETLNALFEQSVLIEEGMGFSETADWWFFRLNRQGSYPGNVRVMSIAIDYEAAWGRT